MSNIPGSEGSLPARGRAPRLDDAIGYCGRCGISFFWSIEEQKRAQEQGQAVRAPALCPGCRALLPPDGRERGMVKWYNIRKRYGFVVRAAAPDIFVPAASLRGVRFLQTGDLVEFSIGRNAEGPIAEAVRLLHREAT